MLELSWFEFIARGIPEEFLFVLAVHAFSKTGINLKKCLLSGVLFWITVYIIRLLPINFGVHTILNMMTLFILVSFINKIHIIKSVNAIIITYILVFVFEGLNILLLQFIFEKDLNSVMSNPISKTLYGLPSLIVLGIVVIVYYFRLSKRKELKYV